MNKIFKVVYNKTTQTWTAVSELARGQGKSSTGGGKKALTVVAAAAITLASTANAAETSKEYVDEQITKVQNSVTSVQRTVNAIVPLMSHVNNVPRLVC